ncbi:hypothetical protein NDU88_000931 [Pleurodeles waltl]|uniref:Uncharacterized protein n=1 Tax=Pleurodeles waltl TaxID=8319 RepID=A0AAV7MJ40_PLEWA|nr:hypothetical protein NDU88_000931 [Pleurodeles waltl]
MRNLLRLKLSGSHQEDLLPVDLSGAPCFHKVIQSTDVCLGMGLRVVLHGASVPKLHGTALPGARARARARACSWLVTPWLESMLSGAQHLKRLSTRSSE